MRTYVGIHVRADLAGNRHLLMNKGFGAFATVLDERKQRQRDEEVAQELQANKEAALHKSMCRLVLVLSVCDGDVVC